MKTVKKLLCLTIACLLCTMVFWANEGNTTSAFADSPAPQLSYKIELENGTKFFYMRCADYIRDNEYWAEEDTEFLDLESGLYYADTLENIYTIEPVIYQGNPYPRYIYESLILSSDGMCFVNLPWSSYDWNTGKGGVAIEFYKNGALINRYYVDDLVSDTSVLNPSVSHVWWENTSFRLFDAEKNTLSVTTLDAKTYLFDITTGTVYDYNADLNKNYEDLTKEMEELNKNYEKLAKELEKLNEKNAELAQEIDNYGKTINQNSAIFYVLIAIVGSVLVINAAFLILYMCDKRKIR